MAYGGPNPETIRKAADHNPRPIEVDDEVCSQPAIWSVGVITEPPSGRRCARHGDRSADRFNRHIPAAGACRPRTECNPSTPLPITEVSDLRGLVGQDSFGLGGRAWLVLHGLDRVMSLVLRPAGRYHAVSTCKHVVRAWPWFGLRSNLPRSKLRR